MHFISEPTIFTPCERKSSSHTRSFTTTYIVALSNIKTKAAVDVCILNGGTGSGRTSLGGTWVRFNEMHARSPILSRRHASARAHVLKKCRRAFAMFAPREREQGRLFFYERQMENKSASRRGESGCWSRAPIFDSYVVSAVHVRLMGIKAPDTKQAPSCIQINKNRLTALAVEVAQQPVY